MEKTYDQNGKPMVGGKYDSFGFPIAANKAAAVLDANAAAAKQKVSGLSAKPKPKPKKKESGLGGRNLIADGLAAQEYNNPKNYNTAGKIWDRLMKK